MSYLNEFIAKIQKIDYPGFLTLWEEYCNSDELDAKELIAILDVLRRSDMAMNLGRHIERIIPLWQTCQDPDTSYEVLKHLVDIQYAPSDVMADEAIKMIEKRFHDATRYQDKLKIVGLRTKDKIQGSLRNFELLNHLNKGNFVLHNGGWGVGEILDVSFLREECSAEFELAAGKKTISFSTAFKTLEPISKEHILAMRFSQPDILEAQAKKDPVSFMKKFLEELGPKTASEIKDELCDLVIPQDEWTKWWQQTRAKLKKDSMIDCPDDLKTPFKLRREEVTHEERLKKLLSSANLSADEVINIIYGFFRDFPEACRNINVVSFAAAQAHQLLSQDALSTSEELMVYMLLDDMSLHEKKHVLEELIKKETDIIPLFEGISIISLKKRALIMLKTLRHDWKMLFELLLLHIDYNPLRDFVFQELQSAGADKELDTFIAKLIQHPYDAPEAYLWLFQKGLEDEAFLKRYRLTEPKLFEVLLVLLSRVCSSSSHKSLTKKIMNMIAENRFSLVRHIMKHSTIAELKEFLLLSTKCVCFTDHELKIFVSLAEVAQPSLAKPEKKAVMGDDPSIIWCTQEGFHKMQKRVHHIATVETVENAKEIETARSHGDLRENAEFKAALERRDRLQSELKILSDQLALARVISKDDVSTDEVGVGCVIDCLTQNGQTITYKILGPWEADPDEKILSYQSKLAQAMGGKVKGDKFKFHDDELVIVDIRSYLD